MSTSTTAEPQTTAPKPDAPKSASSSAASTVAAFIADKLTDVAPSDLTPVGKPLPSDDGKLALWTFTHDGRRVLAVTDDSGVQSVAIRGADADDDVSVWTRPVRKPRKPRQPKTAKPDDADAAKPPKSTGGKSKPKTAAEKLNDKPNVAKPKTAKPKTAKPPVEKTPDQIAAARATALLKHNGAYGNASGVSASMIAVVRRLLADGLPKSAPIEFGKTTALDAIGAKSLPIAVKLANGTSEPKPEHKSLWRAVSVAYGWRKFGTTSAGTQNKLTGRKVACVLAAIAEQSK